MNASPVTKMDGIVLVECAISTWADSTVCSRSQGQTVVYNLCAQRVL